VITQIYSNFNYWILELFTVESLADSGVVHLSSVGQFGVDLSNCK